MEVGKSMRGAGMASTANGDKSAEDAVRTRKPYTVTKRRESWTDDEHRKFVQALQMFDRDWKKIEQYVGTKSVIQIRSHAQKYFLKVQKNGTGEHVPPPRPKRKSAKPYPKAPQSGKYMGQGKNPGEANMGNMGNAEQVGRAQVAVGKGGKTSGGTLRGGGVKQEQGLAAGPQGKKGASRPNVPQEAWMSAAKMSWPMNYGSSNSGEVGGASQAVKSEGGAYYLPQNQRASGAPSVPNFTKVYSFLGSLFDPEETISRRRERLKHMAPIDRQTIVLLMRNLAINLQSPQIWNEQIRLLSKGLPNFVLEKNPSASRQKTAV